MPSLMFQIGANAAGFNAAMNAIKSKAASTGAEIGKSLKGQLAAALSASAMIGGASSTLAFADNLQTLSERLGVSVEMLQKMNHVATQSNTSIDAFASAIEKINVARSEALADPNSAAALNLGTFGITGVDLTNMRSEEILINKIGRALKTMDPQQAGAALRGILGRGTGEIIPALAAFDELAAGIRVASAESVAGLAAVSDQLDALVNQIKTDAIPSIVALWDFLSRAAAAKNAIDPWAMWLSFTGARSGGASVADSLKAVWSGIKDNANAAFGPSQPPSSTPSRRAAMMNRFRASMADASQASRAGGGAASAGGSSWNASRTASQSVGAFISPLVLSIQRGQTNVMRTIARNTGRTNELLARPAEPSIYE